MRTADRIVCAADAGAFSRSLRLGIFFCGALGAAGCEDDPGAVQPQPEVDQRIVEADAGVVKPDAADRCALPSFSDDILLDRGAATPLPAAATRAAALGDRAIACGDGYVSAVDPKGTTAAPNPKWTLTDARLTGRCVGIAAVGTDRALVATREGQILLLAFDASAGWSVVEAASVPETLYDVAAVDGNAWVAAGDKGVLAYNLTGDKLTAGPTLGGARDARGLAAVDTTTLLVADGYVVGKEDDPSSGGAEVRLISTAGGGSVVAEAVGLPGIATRVLLDAPSGRAILLRPGNGFDVLSVTSTALSLSFSVRVKTGMPLDVALQGDSLVLAAGSMLHRYRLAKDSAEWVSLEGRASRGALTGDGFRALTQAAGRLVAFSDSAAIPVALGDGAAAPEIETEEYTLSMASDQTEALFKILNSGTAPLIVTGVATEAPFSAEINTELSTPREGCPGHFVVEPGDVLLAWQRHNGDGSWTNKPLRVTSNDPDEPEFALNAEIHRPVAKAGDLVEDFSLLTVGGDRVAVSQFRKSVVLTKLYSPL